MKFNEQLSFKYFLNIALFREISLNLSGFPQKAISSLRLEVSIGINRHSHRLLLLNPFMTGDLIDECRLDFSYF